MALFPITAEKVQLSTDAPVATDSYVNGVLCAADNSVARAALSGGAQWSNGLLMTALGQVVYVDATAGLPVGTQYVNGIPLDPNGAMCVAFDAAAASWSSGLPFATNGAIAGTGFSPLTLFAGGEAGPYYDAATLVSLYQDAAATTAAATNGQTVQAMKSLSPNAVTAVAATAPAAPLLQFDEMGRGYLAFDGADDLLAFACPSLTVGMTMLVAVLPNTNSLVANQTAIGDSADATQGVLYIRTSVNAQLSGNAFGGALATASGYTVDLNDVNILSIRALKGGVRELRANGVLVSTSTAGTTDTVGRTWNIGKAAGLGFLNGRFYGAVLVDRSISNSEIDSTASSMKSRYSVASAGWRAQFSNFSYPGWMSADGLELWNWSNAQLRRSLDDGKTWDLVKAFAGGSVHGVRQLDTGELIVSDLVLGGAGRVWKSTGYTRANPTAATWSQVLTCSGADTYIQGQWGMWVHGSTVLLSEYGAKGPTVNARYAYRSIDGGDTFTVIYDWNGGDRHIHGIAYDQWRDRVWVVLGDGVPGVPGGQGIIYSDNWREATPSWTVLSDTVQPVGCMPMEKAVLFPTDDPANGVRRWNAATGVLDVAISVDPTAGILTHLGGLAFRRSTAHPVFIPIGAVPGVTGRGYVIATNDGLNLSVIWRDTQQSLAGGLATIMGPTATGKLIGDLRDGRNAARSQLVINSWNVS